AEALELSGETPERIDDFIKKGRRRQLLEHSGDFSACHTIDDLSGLILYRAMELTGARNGYLFLSEDTGMPPALAASRHLDEGSGDEYSGNIVIRVFDTGQTTLTTNAKLEKEFTEFRSVSRYGLKSVRCAPVRYNDLVNGVVYLDNNLVTGLFGPEDADNLALLFSRATLAIENRLLHEMLRKAGNENKRPRKSKADQANLSAALDYLVRHYSEEVTRDDLADDLGLSPDYVGKLLKTHTGKTIREQLNEIRVKQAMEMLADPDRKIIEIAMKVGFDSMRTFYRVFFRVTGMTPTEYRERG
ncbi:MAG: helix-turn-helix domain-containing protein, partial [Chrysiogenales bacterium]